MEIFVLGLIGIIFIFFYIYSFVLLWTDKKFDDLIKLLGTILFLVIPISSWVYLLYKMYRD